MFDIIGKDINSVNLYFWGAALINKRGGGEISAWTGGCFSRTAFKDHVRTLKFWRHPRLSVDKWIRQSLSPLQLAIWQWRAIGMCTVISDFKNSQVPCSEVNKDGFFSKDA